MSNRTQRSAGRGGGRVRQGALRRRARDRARRQLASLRDAATEAIVNEHGRIDVLVHNAGHMVTGPAEAFTPEQFAELYDVTCSHQCVNRAALPHVRRQGPGALGVVPGAFTSGTNHFAHAGRPSDTAVAEEYETRYAGLMEQVGQKLATLEPVDADAGSVATGIARIVALPAGKRPYRVHVDPSRDGSEEVSAVADRVRRELLRRVDLEDLLSVSAG